MYLAYSAINTINDNQNLLSENNHHQSDNEALLRYEAYQNACNKYSREIAAIQKYMPGWMPKFR